jgi:pilus assembly protein Flp/PilA
MKELWNKFMADESGQGLVEYILIIALVAIGIMGAMFIFRGQLETMFETITTRLRDAPGDAGGGGGGVG